MDFELTDEQRLIQSTVRSFVDERVLPNAIENDLNHHLDLRVIEGMAELGLLGIVIPEEYGGAGKDLLAPGPAREEIEGGEGAVCPPLSLPLRRHPPPLLPAGGGAEKKS